MFQAMKKVQCICTCIRHLRSPCKMRHPEEKRNCGRAKVAVYSKQPASEKFCLCSGETSNARALTWSLTCVKDAQQT